MKNVSAVISFATGTSWGTYAIMIPIALPLASGISGDPMSTLVVASFAAARRDPKVAFFFDISCQNDSGDYCGGVETLDPGTMVDNGKRR